MAKEYVRIGIDQAEVIIRILVDHYRAGRLRAVDDIAVMSMDRAQLFLAAREKQKEYKRRRAAEKIGRHRQP